MITFKQLTIQNFMSFGHKPTVIKLDTNDNTLILGKNKDVGSEGYSRNGVGKSTIFQALSWVLFNEGISNIKQDAFVNIVNKKKMVIELTMAVDDIEFVIRRGRKPAVCEVLKDGEPYTMHSAATVDETIEKLIGINFDTFCNAVMLNTTTTPFMGMKPAPQRNFMEKMVGLDILSERANALKARNKDVAVEIKLEEQNKEHVLSNQEKTQARIDKLVDQSKQWIFNNMNESEDLEREIMGLSVIDTEQTLKDNQKRRDQLAKIEEVKKLLSEVESNTNIALGDAKNDYERILEKIATECKVVELESKADYDKQISEVESALEKTLSKLKSKSSEKSIDLITEKGQVEKDLAESKSLLKETDTYLIDSAKRLKGMVDKETKLQDERDILSNGTCPYCKQPHIDNDRIDEISEELKTINDDAKEIGDDNERVMEGKLEVEADIKKYEKRIEELTSQINDIEGELEKEIDDAELSNYKERGEIVAAYKEVVAAEENVKASAEAEAKDEYEKHVSDIKLKANKTKSTFEEDIIEFESELIDEVYTDEECAEIVSTIKLNKTRLKKLKAELNPYTEQLAFAKEELVEYDETVLNELRDKESHYKLLIKMLTDNKSFVRKNLLDQYVPFINSKIAEYTEKLELPHIVTINNDLTVDVEYMQSSVSYGNLSNGERGRLDFSVSMAFRDLLSVSGHKFNFLGIDEILDNGIDTSGFHAIFKLLKEHEKESVFLISHRDDLITEVSNTMEVIKENGFTRIA